MCFVLVLHILLKLNIKYMEIILIIYMYIKI